MYSSLPQKKGFQPETLYFELKFCKKKGEPAFHILVKGKWFSFG